MRRSASTRRLRLVPEAASAAISDVEFAHLAPTFHREALILAVRPPPPEQFA